MRGQEKRSVPRQGLLITLDGPAGVGKSTASKRLAERLKYRWLDTGALYRAVAWKVQREQLDPNNLEHIRLLLSQTSIHLKPEETGFFLLLDGKEIDQKSLRTPTVSHLASCLASLSLVREWLLSVQRGAGQVGGVVAEGRDMGTRVFPDADIKFFLYADLEVRANRRQQELVQKGETCSLESVRDALAIRDDRDQTRELDPLRPDSHAMMIDTSRRSIDEVVNHMMEMIEGRL